MIDQMIIKKRTTKAYQYNPVIPNALAIHIPTRIIHKVGNIHTKDIKKIIPITTIIIVINSSFIL